MPGGHEKAGTGERPQDEEGAAGHRPTEAQGKQEQGKGNTKTRKHEEATGTQRDKGAIKQTSNALKKKTAE